MKCLSIFSLACMVLSCVATSSAQEVKLGAAGFLASANWTSKASDSKARAVVGLGGAAQYQIKDMLSIGAELMFSSIGPAIIDDGDGFSGRFSLKTIQIPLFASYEVMDKLQVHAGFQPALILSANAIIKNEPKNDKYDLSEDYRSMNMDFILGGSYDITDQITAMLRINQGLVDIETDRESRDFKTTGIQIGVRYWLLKK